MKLKLGHIESGLRSFGINLEQSGTVRTNYAILKKAPFWMIKTIQFDKVPPNVVWTMSPLEQIPNLILTILCTTWI